MSAGDDKTLKVIIVKSKAAPLVIIDPFMVFSTFDMDTLGKIFLRHWKEHGKASTLAKFQSDLYILSKRIYSSTELHKFTGVWRVCMEFSKHNWATQLSVMQVKPLNSKIKI